MSVASIALAIWLYLLFARGAFWLNTERDEPAPPAPPSWPRVVAVVPARNEAASIGESIGSLLRQDYPGEWSIVLVDDDSNDGTGDVARRAAGADASRLTRRDQPDAAAGLDRQAVGGEAGHRRRDGDAAAARLPAAHRRRHRPCAGLAAPPRRARAGAAGSCSPR